MDTKYGQLFTEADVTAILNHFNADFESDFGEVADQAAKEGVKLTFPADEPQMVLRGQDSEAESTIAFYRNQCAAEADIPSEHTDGVHKALLAFQAFASAHPDRMKYPD